MTQQGESKTELPTWAPVYFAAWGSARPDGRRMSVQWAARLAGVSCSAVRNWRSENKHFRALEHIARHGGVQFMTSFTEAGIRAAAPAILQAYLKLVGEGHPQMVLQGLKLLLDRPDIDVNLRGAIAQGGLSEWADVPEDELDQVIANLQAAVGLGAGGKTAPPGPDRRPGPAAVDDPPSPAIDTGPAV
jgi:hypothetical protein